MRRKSDRLCARKGGSYSALKIDILDVVTWKKPDEGLLLFLFYQVLMILECRSLLLHLPCQQQAVGFQSLFQPAQIFHEQAHTEAAGTGGAVGHFMIPI